MKENVRMILAGVGLTIVGLSHLYMLFVGIAQNMVVQHAIANLVAGVLLAIAIIKK